MSFSVVSNNCKTGVVIDGFLCFSFLRCWKYCVILHGVVTIIWATSDVKNWKVMCVFCFLIFWLWCTVSQLISVNILKQFIQIILSFRHFSWNKRASVVLRESCCNLAWCALYYICILFLSYLVCSFCVHVRLVLQRF